MPNAEIVDQDFGFDNLLDRVGDLTKMDVDVGYAKPSGGFGVTELAIVQEMGTTIKVTEKMRKYLSSQGLHLKKTTTEITIPSRPFVRESFDNNKDELGEKGIKLLIKYLDEKLELEPLLEVWGDEYRNIMRNGVTTRELSLAENHPFTIQKKGSDTPLINTKRMLNAAEVTVNTK
jgi:hypothetical protein